MDETAKLLRISKALEHLIDPACNEIFTTYRDKFLTNEIYYIIPAVWGVAEKGRELDQTQKEIHLKTNGLVEQALSVLAIPDISDAQAFAIRYLINRTVIYTISYLIEMTRNQIASGRIQARNLLINTDPAGHA